MSKMGLHESFEHLRHIWPKERPRVKLAFDSWPLKVKNRPDFLVCRWRATYHWKALDEGYNFGSNLISCIPFSKKILNIKWMVDPPTLGTSCAFTRTTPFLDEILTSLLCPSMSTLLWVMNSIPKTQSIPPKVETNKSTFPLQFPSWRGTSFARNVVGWAKCTPMGTWVPPIGARFFLHFLGLWSCGKPLYPKDITHFA